MTETLKDSRRYGNRFLDRLAALIGIGSCSMLVMFAFIGVFRGYSVQSKMLTWLLPFVMVCILFYGWQENFKSSMICFCWAVVIVYMFIGSLQGVHYNRGVVFYNQGRYTEAAAELKKETQLWYLKLNPNSPEPFAMQGLAETYCQLEEYDKAVGVYELIISRYQGVSREVASFRLQRLKDGLRFFAQYNEGDVKSQNDYRKLYDMAGVYEYNLNSYKKAVDIYKTIVEMNIPVEEKKNAYDAILRLTPTKNNNH